MLLLEGVNSPYFARIERAAIEAGLSVQRVDGLDAASGDAALIGVGPSIRDPLHVAGHLQSLGGTPLLLFFAASSSVRHSLQAELIRDPFLCPRYEIVELPDNPRRLAATMGRVVAQVKRQLHAEPGSSRRPGRRSHAAANRPQASPLAEPYLANIVAHTSDAVFTTDATAHITTWNRAAERLFGFTSKAAVGQPVDFLDPPGRPARRLGAVVKRVLTAGVPEESQVICATITGGSIDVAANVAPVSDAEGAHLGLSVIARDGTEHQRLEEALHEARRQKDEFLAIMSHELRTPLTSILGYTDLLLRGLSGPLPPLTARYVGNVRTAGDRLLDLVNGLLDYTRLEAGAERLEVSATELSKLAEQAVAHFQAQATARQIDLQVLASSGPGLVQADAEKIGHVLRSYLSNALKFTPDGGWITVRVHTDPEMRNLARVSVADSGVGLHDEQVARVWERFYQGDASLTRPYGGMGLGLSIARHLVALHGGTVGAESAGPGRGSMFWLALPVTQPN